MVICGNIFSKNKNRVVIKSINEENKIDFTEYEDPKNCIKNYKFEDFVVIKLDKSKLKITKAYILDKKNELLS